LGTKSGNEWLGPTAAAAAYPLDRHSELRDHDDRGEAPHRYVTGGVAVAPVGAAALVDAQQVLQRVFPVLGPGMYVYA
jgi:hypothetical protein